MKSVLVVDDEPVLRVLVRGILQDEGYTVIDASTAFLRKPFDRAELMELVADLIGPARGRKRLVPARVKVQ